MEFNLIQLNLDIKIFLDNRIYQFKKENRLKKYEAYIERIIISPHVM